MPAKFRWISALGGTVVQPLCIAAFLVPRHIAPLTYCPYDILPPFAKKGAICRRGNMSHTVGQYVAGLAVQTFEVGQYVGGEMALGLLSIPLEIRHIAPLKIANLIGHCIWLS